MGKSKDSFLDEQMAAVHGTPTNPNRKGGLFFVSKQSRIHYTAMDLLNSVANAIKQHLEAMRKLEEVKADVAPAMQPFDPAVNRATMEVLDARAKLYKLNSDYVDTLFSLVEAAGMDDCSPSKTAA